MGSIISVVVCTYNREEHIEKCIHSLLAQTLDRDLFEIIIVDNASTDNTAAILKRFSHEQSFRIIYEPEPGLSVARNRGWREATGKYISYLDDDAVAHQGWLLAAYWAFEHLSPDPQCLTGTINLNPEHDLPEWISKDLQVCLGYLQFGKKPLQMHYTTHKIIGANCHFTRKILEKTGGFDERLGRKGKLLLSGEEVQLQRTIECLDGAIWFHPDVSVTHFVGGERLCPKWFYKRYFWGGVSDIYMQRMSSVSVDLCVSSENCEHENEGSKIGRLLKNICWALGFGSRIKVIHGRIYLSYVIGHIYGCVLQQVECKMTGVYKLLF